MILFLHGLGERGSDPRKVRRQGLPKLAAQQPDFPFIVLAPQCPAGQWWFPEILASFLQHAFERYPIDQERVYLTGLSMGGYGALSLAVRHPECFAAVAAICPWAVPRITLAAQSKIQTARLKRLPFWLFHGARDPVVPVTESLEMAGELKKFGCAEVNLTIYRDAEHDAWTQSYENPKLYEWFLQHRRT